MVPDDGGTRPGSGIGLAVVKQAIEEVHRGRVFFTTSPVRSKGGRSAISTNDVVDVEYETTFTIELQRMFLDSLGASLAKTGGNP